MRKYFILLIAFTFSSLLLGQTTNVGVGLSPFGGAWIKYKSDSGENTYMKLDYSSYLNGHAYYERQMSGINFLIEGSYAKANFKEIEVDENYNFTDDPEDIQVMSLHFYGGQTLNKKKRLQIPVYYGAGFDYVSGEPIDKFFISLSFKLRLKMYINNKIAVYGGASYDTGMGTEDKGENKSDRVGYNAYHADAGITFSL